MRILMNDFLNYAKSLGYIVIETAISKEYITFPDTQDTYAIMIVKHTDIFAASSLETFGNRMAFFGVNDVSIEEAKKLLQKYIVQRKNVLTELKKKALEKDFK